MFEITLKFEEFLINLGEQKINQLIDFTFYLLLE